MFVHCRSYLLCLLLCAALSAGATPSAAAVERTRTVEAHSPLQLALHGPGIKQRQASSAAEAAKIAKRRYGGKILKVTAVRSENGVRYLVKILLDNGRVKTVVISG